jgi:ABC-2 type transport system permease protein
MSTSAPTLPAAPVAMLPVAAPMKVSRLLNAYCTEARYEILRTLRTPAFLLPTIALPLMLYVFFGIVLGGHRAAADPNAALLILSGFAMFAVIGPGMFGIGIGFAMERQYGIVTLKRALPMPPAANLLAKVASSMVLALLVIAALMVLGVMFGHVSLTASQVVRFALVGVLGVVPFCALGLLIGTLVSGTAAPAVVNLIYFPMIYLSGLFPFPLPKALQIAAVFWPAFHLNQLSLGALGLKTFLDAWIAGTVLAVIALVCVVIAARRLTRVG